MIGGEWNRADHREAFLNHCRESLIAAPETLHQRRRTLLVDSTCAVSPGNDGP
jgi:hypothetical protein